MVATVTQSSNPVKLNRRKLAFARAIAQGATQQRAYELACPNPVTPGSAAVLGTRWANQPAVKAKVNELLSLADAATHLRITERRTLLADTARNVANRPSTHSERIAAIKLDAQLSGDLGGEQALTVNIGALLGALGPPVRPVIPPAPTEGVGCPNDGAMLRAMHPHLQSESPSGFFTKAVSGVFTNELGEVEEVG